MGHAGTLDPAASGLLVLGVGSGTGLLTFLVGLDKAYDATIRLGIATDSDDAEGWCSAPSAVVRRFRWNPHWRSCAAASVQRPAAVSAIKVAGRRSYQRVRSGEDVVLSPTRHGHIFRGAGSAYEHRGATPVVDLDVSVTVSSGTYVRPGPGSR